jgi:CheY-like chemotaxis protein
LTNHQRVNAMIPAWKILIVDDEAAFRFTLAAGLALEGFEVDSAGSAPEALELIQRHRYDLALVDLMMPGMHGLDLARRMKTLSPRVQVVLTSAYYLSQQQLKLADCGAVGFLPKPYGLDRAVQYLRSKLASAVLVA